MLVAISKHQTLASPQAPHKSIELSRNSQKSLGFRSRFFGSGKLPRGCVGLPELYGLSCNKNGPDELEVAAHGNLLESRPLGK